MTESCKGCSPALNSSENDVHTQTHKDAYCSDDEPGLNHSAGREAEPHHIALPWKTLDDCVCNSKMHLLCKSAALDLSTSPRWSKIVPISNTIYNILYKKSENPKKSHINTVSMCKLHVHIPIVGPNPNV